MNPATFPASRPADRDLARLGADRRDTGPLTGTSGSAPTSGPIPVGSRALAGRLALNGAAGTPNPVPGGAGTSSPSTSGAVGFLAPT